MEENLGNADSRLKDPDFIIHKDIFACLFSIHNTINLLYQILLNIKL